MLALKDSITQSNTLLGDVAGLILWCVMCLNLIAETKIVVATCGMKSNQFDFMRHVPRPKMVWENLFPCTVGPRGKRTFDQSHDIYFYVYVNLVPKGSHTVICRMSMSLSLFVLLRARGTCCCLTLRPVETKPTSCNHVELTFLHHVGRKF